MNKHSGKRAKVGPKTKASRGETLYKRLSITVPQELWEIIEAEQRPGETVSGLIQRLLKKCLIPY